MTSRPITLWYLPVSDLGGVFRHAHDVARVGMTDYKIVFLMPPGPGASKLRDDGHPVIVASVGPEHGLRSAVSTFTSVVHRLRPRVVHSHLAFADLVAACAPVPPGIRRITTEHGISGDVGIYHPRSMRRLVTPRVHALRLRRFDAAIAVSASTAEEMRRQWRAQLPITVIHNGRDSREMEARPAGRRLLTLSRLAPEKRIDVVLNAFADLRAVDRGWTLTIAGDGPLRDELTAHAAQLGVSEAVSFPGFVDADSALRSHDVLVQLSAWENCSYSLIDASAQRMGVVASDVGGNAELLPVGTLVDSAATDLSELILRQASVPSARPTLPNTWPTVREMVHAIEDVYGGHR